MRCFEKLKNHAENGCIYLDTSTVLFTSFKAPGDTLLDYCNTVNVKANDKAMRLQHVKEGVSPSLSIPQKLQYPQNHTVECANYDRIATRREVC